MSQEDQDRMIALLSLTLLPQGPFQTDNKSLLNELIADSTKLLCKIESQEENWNEWISDVNDLFLMKRSMNNEQGKNQEEDVLPSRWAEEKSFIKGFI